MQPLKYTAQAKKTAGGADLAWGGSKNANNYGMTNIYLPQMPQVRRQRQQYDYQLPQQDAPRERSQDVYMNIQAASLQRSDHTLASNNAYSTKKTAEMQTTEALRRAPPSKQAKYLKNQNKVYYYDPLVDKGVPQ